jgi:hypothetical protein
MCEAVQFREVTLPYLGQPGIQTLSLAFAHHPEKVLGQLVSRLQIWMGLAKRRQVHLLAFIQMVWVSHEQAHCGA